MCGRTPKALEMELEALLGLPRNSQMALTVSPLHSGPQFPFPALTILFSELLWSSRPDGVAPRVAAAGWQWCPAPAPPTSPGGEAGRVGRASARIEKWTFGAASSQSPASFPASPRSPAMSCYIYQLPSWVLDDLCRNIDTLSDWDWMHFGE